MENVPIKSDNSQEEKPVDTSPKLEILRDEKGRILPGQSSLNPNGRPSGSISIRDLVRRHLEESPEDLQNFLLHFIHDNRELAWTMLEGKPKQQMEVDVDKESILELTKFFKAMADYKKDDGDTKG